MRRIWLWLIASTLLTLGCSHVRRETSASPRFEIAQCQIAAVEASTPSTCDVAGLLKAFEGEHVASYDHALRSIRPGQMVIEPQEFSAVKKCGKSTVPGLIDLISDHNGYIGEAAWRALDDITNRNPGTYSLGTDPPSAAERAVVAEKYRKWWNENKGYTEIDWLKSDLGRHDNEGKAAIYKLGTSGDPVAVSALKPYLADKYLRPYVGIALARLGDRSAIPVLLDDYMGSEWAPMRKEGICVLYGLTGRMSNFDPYGTAESRKIAIEEWKAWWQGQQKPQD